MKIEVSRTGKSINPHHPTVPKHDQISWHIDSIAATESLVVQSSDPSVVPTTTGSPGSDTLKVTPVFPPVSSVSLTYTIYILNGSQDQVASDDLVIEPIGMGNPKPTYYGPDHDRKQ